MAKGTEERNLSAKFQTRSFEHRLSHSGAGSTHEDRIGHIASTRYVWKDEWRMAPQIPSVYMVYSHI